MIHHAEVGSQERMHHLLSVDVVADADLIRDGVAQELQHRLPGAVAGHGAYQTGEGVLADGKHADVLIDVAQIAVQQARDGLVGNAQPRHEASGGRQPRAFRSPAVIPGTRAAAFCVTL